MSSIALTLPPRFCGFDLCVPFCTLELRVRSSPFLLQFPRREPESGLPC